MSNVFLLFGGNLGSKEKTITQAVNLIENRIGILTKKSAFYESEPWGFKDKNSFINQLIIFETKKTPFEILNIIKEIETELGRIRSNDQFSSRTIDIDILFYDQEIVQGKNLIIPHPRIQERRFTLEPLVEIEPNFVHPVLKKTMIELLNICDDSLWVKRIL